LERKHWKVENSNFQTSQPMASMTDGGKPKFKKK
jgi:hypothetical protein